LHEKYKFKRQYQISEMSIEDVPETSSLPNPFRISSTNALCSLSFIVCAPSKELKNAWMKDIIKCIEEQDAHESTFAVKKNTMARST